MVSDGVSDVWTSVSNSFVKVTDSDCESVSPSAVSHRKPTTIHKTQCNSL